MSIAGDRRARSSSLNAARRAAELHSLAAGDVVDVLVIGGGVTGCGVALDAAARGLSVCLLEAHDLAFGTSRWSSKLVHGGLRYLASGDVAVARRSAMERGALMTTIAPHLTRALPQLIPFYQPVSAQQAAVTMTELLVGDLLRRASRSPSEVLPSPRRVPAEEALARVPGLRGAGLRGGLLCYDGQLVDDARLVVALARTAALFGAKVLTRSRVTALDSGGARVRDEWSDRELDVRARAVVNATGVWAGQLVDSIELRPSRGSHLVLDADAVGLKRTALIIPIHGASDRFAFLLPQLGNRVYLGLTDEPVDGPIPDVPEVPEYDVRTLLDVASTALARRLTRDNVLGVFAGLRPLIAARGTSANLSRRHLVHTAAGGVVSVVGGKLTTYRAMAAEAVDVAAARAGLAVGPSTTRRLGLVGAAPRSTLSTVDAPAALVARYGTEAATVAALAEVDAELGTLVVEHSETTAAEVVWAVRHEGALCAEDVLDRRTRISLVPADRAAALDRVDELVRRTLAGLEPTER